MYIEVIEWAVTCSAESATPVEYKAGLHQAIERGWLELRESGTYVKFTPTGAVFA